MEKAGACDLLSHITEGKEGRRKKAAQNKDLFQFNSIHPSPSQISGAHLVSCLGAGFPSHAGLFVYIVEAASGDRLRSLGCVVNGEWVGSPRLLAYRQRL